MTQRCKTLRTDSVSHPWWTGTTNPRYQWVISRRVRSTCSRKRRFARRGV